MKLSEGVEWAIHSCSLLAALPTGAALPTRKLAAYFELSETYLAKNLQLLSNADIVTTRKGPGGGYALAKAADAISLLDIVEAIEGRSPCFSCTEIRRRGPTGIGDEAYKRPCGIARSMWKAEKAWRDELAKVSLHKIQAMALEETPDAQLEKAKIWFEEALA